MRISDWSSDVCSSDLLLGIRGRVGGRAALRLQTGKDSPGIAVGACGSGNLIVELGQLPRERLDSDSQTVSIDVFQGRDKLIQSLAVARRDDRGFRFADRVAQGARCSRTLDGRTQALQVGSARLLPIGRAPV